MAEDEALEAERERVRAKLEALATDESEDAETREWALAVLEGRESFRDPPPRADGGEGRDAPPRRPSADGRMNDILRVASGRMPRRDPTRDWTGGA